MTDSVPIPFQPGDVLLGKYRVDRVLGKGGMGMVVAAQHVQLGGLFAIKIMLPEMLDNPEAVGRFLREAQASSRLRSEHVVRVHDVGTLENGIPYMVLEYLEGQDLDRELTSRGVLGVGQSAAYLAQVAEALIEAHAAGIVHRDLKPANLFLTRRANGSSCIKVLDFGISKDVTAGNQAAQKLTQTGSIMGSPHYMSPEQLIDSKNVDARSDIWALGIILYELVTGRMPFHAETMPEIVARVLSTTPPAPITLRPDLPPAFEAIILKCIEKERDNRFQSVQEFLNALKPFVNEQENPSRVSLPIAPSAALSATKWEQETIAAVPAPTMRSGAAANRKWLVMAAVGGVAMLGILGFVLVGSRQGGTAEQPRVEVSHAPANVSANSASTVPMAEPPVSAESSQTEPSTVPATAKVGVGTVIRPTGPNPPTSAPPVVTTSTSTKKKKVKGFEE